MPRSVRFLLAAACLAASVPVAAQDGLVWIGGETPERVGLLYGLPDSDHVVFTLECDRESFAVAVTYLLDGEIGRPEPFVLNLASEGGATDIDAAQVHLEMLDLDLLEAKTVLDEALAAIFTTGDTLTVTVGDLTQEIPLPAAEEIQPLLDACLVVG